MDVQSVIPDKGKDLKSLLAEKDAYIITPSTVAPDTRFALGQHEINHFLEHGYIKLKSCFSREQAERWTSDMWERLRIDPNDRTTWSPERTWLPQSRFALVKDFAPKAWSAICELVGFDCISLDWGSIEWCDNFIVNLGTTGGEGKTIHPKLLRDWHVDGYDFIKFLDSPEQALLVTPLFSDIVSGGGGTFICPSSIDKMAQYLWAHPEGVNPCLTTRDKPYNVYPEDDLCSAIIATCDDFVEMTGDIGDVYLSHPLMVHCHSNNMLRIPRLITNPPVKQKVPFQLNGSSASLSVVGRKTILALKGKDLSGWKITSSRQKLTPISLIQTMSAAEQRKLRDSGLNIAITALDATQEERRNIAQSG